MGHMITLLGRRFTPDALPGLELWLDAADPATIALSGGNATQWNDKSGNGRHMTQGTGAAQPVYDTTAMAGHPGISFDTTDNMSNASFPQG